MAHRQCRHDIGAETEGDELLDAVDEQQRVGAVGEHGRQGWCDKALALVGAAVAELALVAGTTEQPDVANAVPGVAVVALLPAVGRQAAYWTS